MTFVLWSVAILLGLFWLYVATFNLLTTFAIRRGSIAPLIGGIAGGIACLVCPMPGVARWAWLPLLLDLGCVPFLLLFGYLWATRSLSKSEEDQTPQERRP